MKSFFFLIFYTALILFVGCSDNTTSNNNQEEIEKITFVKVSDSRNVIKSEKTSPKLIK